MQIHFNPRTRVGCDLFPGAPRRIKKISIHAPGWGATRVTIQTSKTASFQSTHPGGVRPKLVSAKEQLRPKFQSTHPGGVRLSRYRDKCKRFKISIHAPGWGATFYALILGALSAHFNPRTRVGCDKMEPSCATSAMYFNPRTRVGCDKRSRASAGLAANFNPRTRVGCDQRSNLLNSIAEDFNPRTRVGCDIHLHAADHRRFAISIHAPGWGATKTGRFEKTACGAGAISIHAPGWGATL